MAQAAQKRVDDELLVGRWQAGDPAAMDLLVRKYQNRIYNVILKMCGNVDDAAELTQETFVKVIENADRFEKRSSFYTWVFRIAVNLTLNFCQRKAKVAFGSLDAGEDERASDARKSLRQVLQDDSTAGPSEIAENNELCRLLLGSLMKLDVEHRAVIVMRDIEGMNYAQIATVLELELGTVKSRISRARSRLRRILEAMI